MYIRTLTLAGPASPAAYTCPAGRAALIKSLYLANAAATSVAVTVTVTPVTGPATLLISGGVLPKNATLDLIDNTLVLLPGDVVTVHTPGASGDVHATLSGMEVQQQSAAPTEPTAPSEFAS